VKKPRNLIKRILRDLPRGHSF